jgi:hypothetical protein
MSVVNIAVKQIIGMKVYLIQQTAKKMGRDAQVWSIISLTLNPNGRSLAKTPSPHDR